MATFSVTEDFEGRGGSDEVRTDGKRVITHKRTFFVVTDSPIQDDSVILALTGIPVPWAYYFAANSVQDTSRVVKRTPEQVSPFRWRVSVEYSTEWRDQAKAALNPLERPYTVNWETRDAVVPVEEDEDGNYLATSAFEPWDPPVTEDMGMWVFVVTKNFAFFDSGLYSTFLTPRKAINAGIFFGYDEAKVKCLSINGTDTQNEGDVEYYTVTFRFGVNDDTWDRYLLDRGYCTLDPLTLEQFPIIEGGAIVTTPRLLDGQGGRLARNADPVFLGPIKVNPRRNFDALGIS